MIVLHRLYGDSCQLESIASFLSPKRIPYLEACKQTFAPHKVGDTFGPTWVNKKSQILWPSDLLFPRIRPINQV